MREVLEAPTPANAAQAVDAGAVPLQITGLGLVTPLGRSAWQTFTALLAGKTITDRANENDQNSPFPRLDSADPVSLIRRLGCVASVQHSSTDPALDLAELAAREALTSANIPESDWPTIPCLLASSKGAVHALTRAADHAHQPNLKKFADVIALGPHAFLAHHLRSRLNLGPTRPIVAACASGLTALHLARQAMLAPDFGWLGQSLRRPSQNANGDVTCANRFLVVSSEAALLPMFIHSYRRLGVLPPLTPQHYRSLPLDTRRTGFTLAEQSAAVLLERQPSSDPQPHQPQITPTTLRPPIPQPLTLSGGNPQPFLISTAIASESHHLIHSSPTMPALEHLARQLFQNHTIDVIHPHAPGTPDNDQAELAVYERIFQSPNSSPESGIRNPETAPSLYAPKGALGHGLGAAGLVSLVIACLCAKTHRLPPMPWLQHPIDSPFPLKPQTSNLKPSSSHAIFSSGFGGHVAGAVIGSRP